MLFSPDSRFARPYPSLNHNERQRPISAIILHYTGMPTAEGALRHLCSSGTDVSTHYFVDESGEILQLVSEQRRAWHAGKSFWAGETDMNSASIGIEIAHPGHADPRPFPVRQIDAVAALCREICDRRAIRPERVLAHSDIAVRRKIDPGEFFPWNELARQGVGHFVKPWPTAEGPTLSEGAEGEEVTCLQRSLAAYGYQLALTGFYSPETANVVEAFQRHFRPKLVDGCADISTRRTLDDLIAALEQRRD
jgi:N-acetylmuramoyl-L-alanine amidase